jgi:hypothetical protein
MYSCPVCLGQPVFLLAADTPYFHLKLKVFLKEGKAGPFHMVQINNVVNKGTLGKQRHSAYPILTLERYILQDNASTIPFLFSKTSAGLIWNMLSER